MEHEHTQEVTKGGRLDTWHLCRLLLSSALLILSYPPFDLGWLAWVALVPWLLVLETADSRRAFFFSYLVGISFFAGTVWWIGYVTVIGTILLVAYLALYFAVWGWLAYRAIMIHDPRSELSTLRSVLSHSLWVALSLSAVWAVLEWLRNALLTGFGWNLLAHTQWRWVPLIQVADLTGVYGISFLVAWVNLCLFRCYRHWRIGKKDQALVPIFASLLVVGFAFLYGTVRLQHLHSAAIGSTGSGFHVAAVQGNIPQRIKWDEAFAQAVWKQYESLTQEAAKDKPSLILWPETAAPGFLEEPEVFDRLKAIAQSRGTFLLVGVPTELDSRVRGNGTAQFNSAVLWTKEGQIAERYDKVHLVPFGEYVPLKPILGWIHQIVVLGDFSPGAHYTVFRAGQRVPEGIAPFSVLICFEDLFPALSRRFVQQGARWLVVITNDAWFGRSAASLQHLQASVFRAVENRLWVARAANTGWTGFIDPAGRVVTQAPRFQPAVARARLTIPPLDSSRSFYTRWGDGFLILCGIITILGARPRKQKG